MVKFYRRFIKNYAHIARPLTQLTGNVDLILSDTTQSSFENLERALCSAPVLCTYDPALPITVTTDASGFASWCRSGAGRGWHATPCRLFLRDDEYP
jgi:RNase H-like domain found in reverse transcriptase